MMQWEHIDTGNQPQAFSVLSYGSQKDVLRRRQAMHRRSVVLSQVIGIKPG